MARFSLHVSEKGARAEISPLRGNISTLCIQNEVVLARFARRASEKPCKPLFVNTPCANLARKGPFPGPKRPNHAWRTFFAIPSRQTARMPAPDRSNRKKQLGILVLRDDASAQNGERHWRGQSSITARRTHIQSSNPDTLLSYKSRTILMPPASSVLRANSTATHSIFLQKQKGDPVGPPFNSGTDQKNQLKVIVDDPYLYRSSFSFAAS